MSNGLYHSRNCEYSQISASWQNHIVNDLKLDANLISCRNLVIDKRFPSFCKCFFFPGSFHVNSHDSLEYPQPGDPVQFAWYSIAQTDVSNVHFNANWNNTKDQYPTSNSFGDQALQNVAATLTFQAREVYIIYKQTWTFLALVWRQYSPKNDHIPCVWPCLLDSVLKIAWHNYFGNIKALRTGFVKSVI